MKPLKKLHANGPKGKRSGWRLEKLPKKRPNANRWNAKPQKELRVNVLNRKPSVWPLKEPFFCRRSRNKGK